MIFFKKLQADFFKLKESPELRKSIIYAMASVIAYGVVFLQSFSIAYFVSVDLFGKISLILSLFSTLYVIYTFGLNSVVLRYNFDRRFRSDKQKFISHVVSIWIPLGIVTTIFLLLAGYQIILVNKYLPISFWNEFIPITIAAFLFSSVEIFSQMFIVEENPVGYAFFLIASRVSIFVMLHIAVLTFAKYFYAVSFALLLVGVVVFIISFWVFRFLPVVRVKMKDLKEILVYAFPLMAYSLGGMGYSHGYRVIISNQLSLENLAIFSIVNQIASAYYLAASSCVTGLYPKAYFRLEENLGNPSSIHFYLKALLYIGLAFFVLILPVAYFFLHYFKAGVFMPGFKILPILLLGQFIFFLYGYNYILCTFFKKTKVLTYAMIAGVTMSLSLSSIIMQEDSLWLAAIPIVCGLSVQFIISLVVIRKAAHKYRMT